MEKFAICASFASLTVILIVVAVVMSNPLRRSTERIREDVLQFTPIGTSKDEVLEIINESEWEFLGAGVLHGVSLGHVFLDGTQGTVGTQSARAVLGRYGIRPFRSIVQTWWAFDENGKLIDVFVMRTPTFD